MRGDECYERVRDYGFRVRQKLDMYDMKMRRKEIHEL